MAITSDTHGMIRTSLTALPRRGVVYARRHRARGVTARRLACHVVIAFSSARRSCGHRVSASLFGSVTVPRCNRSVQPGGAGKAVFGSSTLVSSAPCSRDHRHALFVRSSRHPFGLGAIIKAHGGAITTWIGMML